MTLFSSNDNKKGTAILDFLHKCLSTSNEIRNLRMKKHEHDSVPSYLALVFFRRAVCLLIYTINSSFVDFSCDDFGCCVVAWLGVDSGAGTKGVLKSTAVKVMITHSNVRTFYKISIETNSSRNMSNT